MDSIISQIVTPISSIGPFILLLGLLVFVHELGHFLVAKWCGVKVEVFSLGFGKKLLKYRHGDTDYCISMIPLGGYVKMYGESLQAEVTDEQRHQSFIHKPVRQRIAIVLAGPLMNLFFAFFLFNLIGFVGDKQPAALIGDVRENSAAFTAGFRPGDKVVEANGEKVQSYPQLLDIIGKATDREISFKVERQAEVVDLTATPKLAPNENIFSRNSSVGNIEGLSFESNSSLIGVTSPSTIAYQAGLRNLDLITRVNGKDVSSFRELQNAVAAVSTGTIEIRAQSFLNGTRGTERTLQIPAGKSLADMGIEYAETYVLKVKEKSPADVAGLRSGDKIIAVKRNPAQSWTDVLAAIKSFDPINEKSINMKVMREGQEVIFEITPEMTELMNQKGQEENRFTIGIISSNLQVGPEIVMYRPEGIVGKLAYGVQQTWQWTEFTVMSVVRLFQGSVSPKNIGGVITIGRVANQSYEAGLSVFLKTMAIISINLFLLNLLPVPVLDGGHLVFFGLEALKGSPVSLRKLEIAQQVGLTLLLMLMAFALFNDVTNFFTNRW